MVRYALAALAAVVLVGASLIPDDAFARRGGGGGYRGWRLSWRGFMLAVSASVAGDMPVADTPAVDMPVGDTVADMDIIR